jgi:hypothetical protein
MTQSETDDKRHSERPADESASSAASVVERMRLAANCDTLTALAGYLKTTPQNISKWRTRNRIPYSEAVEVAQRTGSSISYILTGRNETKFEAEQTPFTSLNEDILVSIFNNLANSGYLALPNERFTSEHLAEAVANQYERGTALTWKMTQLIHLDYDTAARSAAAALEGLFRDDPIWPNAPGPKRRRKASEGYK